MNSETEVSDEQMAECFGKSKRCGRNCRLKDLCLDKYREEEEENRRRRYREVHYIDDMDAGAGHVSPDFGIEPDSEDDLSSEVISAIEQLDVSDRCRKALLRSFRAQTNGEAAEDTALEMLRRLGEIYINDPTGFEVLFFQILAGGNQAALARQRGCSKQNINKIVAKGRKRLDAYRQMVEQYPERRFTNREIAAYHFIAVKKMSYRQAAAVMGCSAMTVCRLLQNLSSKGVKCYKNSTARMKATKKSNKKIC